MSAAPWLRCERVGAGEEVGTSMTDVQAVIDALRSVVGVEPVDEGSARSQTGSGGAPRRVFSGAR